MPSGVELATAWVRIVPSMEGTQGTVTKALGPLEDEAEASGTRSASRWGSAAKKGFLIAGAAVAAGLAIVFNKGMEEIKFGETINAQSAVILKNTNFSMSIKQIDDFTLALSKVSGVGEEELQQAGNAVLKFGDVSQENYKKAVNSINDLAATGKDAAGVGEMLGKALADPATAAAKLKRAGVQLTAQQQEQIKAFVATGDKASAQGVILDGLESTYGGMAEAAGATTSGGINKLNNAFDNLSGDIVQAVMPALSGVLGVLQTVVDWISANESVIPIFAVLIGTVLAIAFAAWAVSIWATTAALLANPVVWIIVGIVALIAAIILLILNWGAVVSFLQDVWAAVVQWLVDTLINLANFWSDVWSNISSFFQTVWSAISSFFMGLWNALLSWYIGLLVGMANFILSTINNISNFWRSVWTNIVNFFTGLWTGVTSFISGVFSGIGDIISTALGVISGIWNSIWSGMVSFIEKVFGGVVQAVKGPMNAVISIINGAISAINGIHIDIPAWVPGVGGQKLGFSIPHIPGLRLGGTVTGTGYTVVGEDGPELLKLPKGSQVNPNYDDVPHGDRTVVFKNYAPLGQTPAQALTEFSNRAKGL